MKLNPFYTGVIQYGVEESIVGIQTNEPTAYLDDLAHRVIGAAIEVHRTLGPGFLESVYQAALSVEMDAMNIAYIPQAPISHISHRHRYR